MKLIVIFLAAVPLLAQTNVTTNFSSTVTQSNIKRGGILVNYETYYDSGQVTKNVINLNPSFNPLVLHSRIACSSAGAGYCGVSGAFSGNQYVNGMVITPGSGYTDGQYVVNATGGSCATQPSIREIFQGGQLVDYYVNTVLTAVACTSISTLNVPIAAGAGAGSGASLTPYYYWPPHTPINVVVHNNTPTVAANGTSTFCSTTGSYDGGAFQFDTPCGSAVSVNDIIDVGPVTETGANTIDYGDGGPNFSGNGYYYADLTDLPPAPNGNTQALALVAPATGDAATFSWGFDVGQNYWVSQTGVPGGAQVFVLMNGTYKLTYWAKGVSGSQGLALSFGRAGKTPYFSPVVAPLTGTALPTLSGSWAQYSVTFNVTEASNPCGAFTQCGANLAVSTTYGAPDKVYLANFSLQQCSPTTGGCTTDPNTTAFRDEVVTRLQSYNPGAIRMWTGDQTTSLNDLIGDITTRKGTNYSGYQTHWVYNWDGYSLHDFLGLTAYLGNGTEAYFVMPVTFSQNDASNLMDYLAGPVSNTSACTGGQPYAIKRCQLGQAAPWTSVIPVIHIEFVE